MKKTLASLLLMLLSAVTVKATPALINYQGRLFYANGMPVSNDFISVDVKLYNAESGGTELYEEDIGQVAVSNALYSFQFGTNSTAFLQSLRENDCWLQLEVNDLPLLPRKQLVSVPYAINSKRVENTTLQNDETSVGIDADGSSDGTAVGSEAIAMSRGVAVGSNADGSYSGVAVGSNADGSDSGVAVGYGANAPLSGVAVGSNAEAPLFSFGIAVGADAQASGRYSLAAGNAASARAENSVAIGCNTSNEIANSVRLRGMLYLDGGDNIYTRETFGSGQWTPLVSGYTGVVTNFDGTATQRLYYTNGLLKSVQ